MKNYGLVDEIFEIVDDIALVIALVYFHIRTIYCFVVGINVVIAYGCIIGFRKFVECFPNESPPYFFGINFCSRNFFYNYSTSIIKGRTIVGDRSRFPR